jgi:hypothetical protein
MESAGALEKAVNFLLEQGLSGLIILALGLAVWKLYTRNQELHTTLYDVGRESVRANETTAAALNRLSDLLLHSSRE